MITPNLFISFEPTNSLFYFNYINIMIIIIVIIIVITLINIKSYNILLQSKSNKFPNSFFKRKISYKTNILFVYYIIINTMGLIIYNYCLRRQLFFNILIIFNFWLALIFFIRKNKSNILLAHLTPRGVPHLLAMFLCLLETVSLLIQPIALRLRITANILAGHVLLTLCINILRVLRIYIVLPLLILELIVCLIQAFVLKILLDIYCETY